MGSLEVELLLTDTSTDDITQAKFKSEDIRLTAYHPGSRLESFHFGYADLNKTERAHWRYFVGWVQEMAEAEFRRS